MATVDQHRIYSKEHSIVLYLWLYLNLLSFFSKDFFTDFTSSEDEETTPNGMTSGSFSYGIVPDKTSTEKSPTSKSSTHTYIVSARMKIEHYYSSALGWWRFLSWIDKIMLGSSRLVNLTTYEVFVVHQKLPPCMKVSTPCGGRGSELSSKD